MDNFEDKFKKFLRRLAIELLTKYIVTPTINAVKSDIMKLNAEIIGNTSPKFEFKIIDTKELMKKLHEPHKNVVRMILKLFAYEKQDILLPEKWEIEHILPQKWQSNYFKNSEDEIKAKIENIGNKLPFEKTLNIVAGNGYFTKKRNKNIKHPRLRLQKNWVSQLLKIGLSIELRRGIFGCQMLFLK